MVSKKRIFSDSSQNQQKAFYKIRIKSKDIHDYESAWSEPIIVNMPRNKAIHSSFLLKFFKQFTILQNALF